MGGGFKRKIPETASTHEVPVVPHKDNVRSTCEIRKGSETQSAINSKTILKDSLLSEVLVS